MFTLNHESLLNPLTKFIVCKLRCVRGMGSSRYALHPFSLHNEAAHNEAHKHA